MPGNMSREQIEKEIAELEVFKKTQDKLKRAGLIIPPKPRDAVEGIDLFTEWENMKKKYGGVANIPFTELGEFLDRWTAMIAYARWQKLWQTLISKVQEKSEILFLNNYTQSKKVGVS